MAIGGAAVHTLAATETMLVPTIEPFRLYRTTSCRKPCAAMAWWEIRGHDLDTIPIPQNCCNSYAVPLSPKKTDHPGRALTVCEVCALSDLDNITVRIADVAANLAVLGNRLRDELGPSTLP